MKIRTPSFRTLFASTLSVAVTAALIGFSAPAANAFTVGNMSAAVTAGANSVSVDLSKVTFAFPPTSIYLSVLKNGGGGFDNECDSGTPALGSYCWSSSVKTLDIDSNFSGTYTVDGLSPNTTYEVEIYPYEPPDYNPDTQAAIVKTGAGKPDAPDERPNVKISTSGLSASVAAVSISRSAIGDSTPKSKLKYNIYVKYSGKWHKVLSSIKADGKYHAVKVPKGKTITFQESVINSIGESPRNPNLADEYKLAPAAPTMGKFSGKIAPTFSLQKWSAAKANAGHITKYVIVVKKGSKTVYKHSYKASTRSSRVSGLHPNTTYTFTLSAYNSYGKHSESATLYGNSDINNVINR